MHRLILRLAIPSIVSNITVPLLGLVDVAITGHMGDTRYMAAIAVGSMVFNIIYWLFSFLRFGTGGMTAQAYGKSDTTECQHVLLRALIVCLSLALLLTTLRRPLFDALMWVVAPGAALEPTIRTYYDICIWGTFPSLALYALTGWFVGMQNTTLPMTVSILQNIINILLSLLFVYALGMKIEGVALGTLLAQWSGMLLAVIMLLWRYGDVWRRVCLRSAVRFGELRRFLSVNSNLFLRTLFLVAVNLYFIVVGARGGEDILSVNSVIMQMFILYTYVIDGFAYAAEALCGKYYGAGDRQGFRLAHRGIWQWSLLLTAAFTVAYAFGGNVLLHILTDDQQVYLAAQQYLPWAVLIPICGVAAFVIDGIFVGITETRGMLWGTFIGALGFFLVCNLDYFLNLNHNHNLNLNCELCTVNCELSTNHLLWLAFNLYLLLRGVVQYIIWHKVWKKKLLHEFS